MRRISTRRQSREKSGLTYPVVINNLIPSEIAAGSGNTVVQVYGGVFSGGTVIQVDGVPVTTVYFDAGRVDATIPSAVIAAPGFKTLTAVDGLFTSNNRIFSVNFPVPTISSLSVSSVNLGGGSTFTIATGTGFFATGTSATVEGVSATGSYGSSTLFSVGIPADVTAVAGEKSIAISNPVPGGGTATTTFKVTYPVPVLGSISPTQLPIQAPATNLVCTGSSFYPASTVEIDGVTVASTYDSPTQITAVVPTTVTASGGTKVVRVRNPAVTGTGGGVSATKNLVVAIPTTTGLDSLSRPQYFDGWTLRVSGTNLTATDTVVFDGVDVPTTYVSATTLDAAVPSSSLGEAGVVDVLVRTVDAYETNAQTFTIGDWTVTDIGSTLRLWLDGFSAVDDGTGRAVTWTDLSGGSRSFTQATAGQRPAIVTSVSGLNDKPAVYFDGARQDLMTGPTWVVSGADGIITKTAYTAYVVSYANVSTQVNSDPTVLGDSAPVINVSNLQGLGVRGLDNATNVDATFSWNGAPLATRNRKSGGNLYVQANRGTESSGAAGSVYSPAGVLLGRGRVATWHYTGYVAEIIVADTDLNLTVKAQLANRFSYLYDLNYSSLVGVPTITSVTPNTSTQFDAAYEITVVGTGFVSTSIVNVGWVTLATTYDSATQVRATVSSGVLATSGVKYVTVSNTVGISGPKPITIAAYVPGLGPNLNVVAPNTATQYDNAFTITCTGSNFTGSSVVQVDGVSIPTTYVSPTSLTATVTAAVLYTSGAKAVTVLEGATSSGSQALTVASWSPASVSAITGWFRADTVTTSGTSVTQWTDKSGNGRHILQATAAKQPTLIASDPNFDNAPSIDFDGTSDVMTGSLFTAYFVNTSWACAVVYRADTITGTGSASFPFANNTIIGSDASGWFGISCRNTPVLYGYSNDGAYQTAENTGLAAAAVQQALFINTGGTMTLRINGTLGTSDTIGIAGFSSQLMNVGSALGGNYFNGQIAEIVCSNATWTATDILRWNNYCADRYGI